jgi:hypothetical protein
MSQFRKHETLHIMRHLSIPYLIGADLLLKVVFPASQRRESAYGHMLNHAMLALGL